MVYFEKFVLCKETFSNRPKMVQTRPQCLLSIQNADMKRSRKTRLRELKIMASKRFPSISEDFSKLSEGHFTKLQHNSVIRVNIKQQNRDHNNY